MYAQAGPLTGSAAGLAFALHCATGWSFGWIYLPPGLLNHFFLIRPTTTSSRIAPTIEAMKPAG